MEQAVHHYIIYLAVHNIIHELYGLGVAECERREFFSVQRAVLPEYPRAERLDEPRERGLAGQHDLPRYLVRVEDLIAAVDYMPRDRRLAAAYAACDTDTHNASTH